MCLVRVTGVKWYQSVNNFCRCNTRIHLSETTVVEWGFLCCSIFACAFQADLAYRSYSLAKDAAPHRVCLSAREPGVHLLLSGIETP